MELSEDEKRLIQDYREGKCSQVSLMEVLKSDVESHRKFVQSLYKSAVAIGAGLLFIIGTGAVWILNKQVNATAFEYENQLTQGIKERLKYLAESVSAEAASEFGKNLALQNQNKIEQAKVELKTKLNSVLDGYVTQQIASLENEDIRNMVLSLSFPKGAVVGFNLSSCPEGWSDFIPAQGAFLRGIDPEGKHDDKNRTLGDFQIDQAVFTGHILVGGGNDSNSRFDTLATTKQNTQRLDMSRYLINNASSNETRPKNTAVRFCEKL